MDANNNVYSLKDLVCKSIPSSTLKLTSNGCSYDRGFIFEAGYTIGTEFFGPEYEICYNNGTETTYYAHNTINGAAIDCKYFVISRKFC